MDHQFTLLVLRDAARGIDCRLLGVKYRSRAAISGATDGPPICMRDNVLVLACHDHFLLSRNRG
jgi:hypothetical protein